MSEDGKAKLESASAMWTVVSRDALIAGHKADGRAVYRREAKDRLIAAALAPGASVAKVAREHGLNANQLHGWIRVMRRQATQKGSKARFSAKVGAGLERAAKLRAQSPRARLVPVAIAENRVEPQRQSQPALSQARLAIEIGGARVVVESAASATIDRTALRAVIDCLRESETR